MPVPLIIDTDPGVDDAVALMLALHSPEVELLAVTTTYGNVSLATTTANAGRLLALAGRADVPVAAGATRPLVHPAGAEASEWHGADGLGGWAAAFPEPGPPDPRCALELTADLLRAAAEPVTIAAIGPLTNTALLLAAHPELAGRIGRIVVMGGAFGANRFGGGNTTASAEFNVHADPEAAYRVLSQSDVPVTLVPLDLTMRCLAGADRLAGLAAAGPRCALLCSAVDAYRGAFRARHGVDAVALHDALAVLEAAVPDTLRATPLPVAVACDHGPARGATLADRRRDAPGAPVGVALDADVDAVLDAVLTRVARLG